MDSVPVISFAPYSLKLSEPDNSDFQRLVDEVYNEQFLQIVQAVRDEVDAKAQRLCNLKTKMNLV